LELTGTPDARAIVRDELCLLCLATNHLDEARRLARAQVQDARSAQSPLRTARALVLVGRVEAARGRHHEALDRYREATAALEREPPQYRSLFAMRDVAVFRARSEHAVGRAADARATLDAVLAELNAQQLRLVTLDVLHELSVIIPLADPDAERIAGEALSTAQDASALWFEARAVLDLALVRRARDTPAEALVTEAEAILNSYGDPITPQRYRERLAAT
jgi:tetratricopeptide (TPR) repeat protein